MNYKTWIDKVDAIVEANHGISYHDLPDMLLSRDSYDQGFSPEEFYEQEVADLIAEEFSIFD